MTRPDLVLIHGWGLHRGVWSPCLDALRDVADVRLADLPGYGDTPDSGQSFVEAAQSLADALPAHATLCGWSLGALLAMQAALLAPERVAGLVLVGATPCFTRHASIIFCTCGKSVKSVCGRKQLDVYRSMKDGSAFSSM